MGDGHQPLDGDQRAAGPGPTYQPLGPDQVARHGLGDQACPHEREPHSRLQGPPHFPTVACVLGLPLRGVPDPGPSRKGLRDVSPEAGAILSPESCWTLPLGGAGSEPLPPPLAAGNQTGHLRTQVGTAVSLTPYPQVTEGSMAGAQFSHRDPTASPHHLQLTRQQAALTVLTVDAGPPGGAGAGASHRVTGRPLPTSAHVRTAEAKAAMWTGCREETRGWPLLAGCPPGMGQDATGQAGWGWGDSHVCPDRAGPLLPCTHTHTPPPPMASPPPTGPAGGQACAAVTVTSSAPSPHPTSPARIPGRGNVPT